MIEPQHRYRSLVRQRQVVEISRSIWYYQSRGDSRLNLQLMRLLDEQ